MQPVSRCVCIGVSSILLMITWPQELYNHHVGRLLFVASVSYLVFCVMNSVTSSVTFPVAYENDLLGVIWCQQNYRDGSIIHFHLFVYPLVILFRYFSDAFQCPLLRSHHGVANSLSIPITALHRSDPWPLWRKTFISIILLNVEKNDPHCYRSSAPPS